MVIGGDQMKKYGSGKVRANNFYMDS